MIKSKKTLKYLLVWGILVFSVVFCTPYMPVSAAAKRSVPKPGKVRITSLSKSTKKTIDSEQYKITVKWKKPARTKGVSYQVAYRTKTGSAWSSWKKVKTKKRTYTFTVKTKKGSQDLRKAFRVKVRAVNSKTVKKKKRTKAGAYSAVKGCNWTVPSLIKKPGAPVQTMDITSLTDAEDEVTAVIDAAWNQPSDVQSPKYCFSYRTRDGEGDYSAWTESVQSDLKKTLTIVSERDDSDDKTVTVQTRVRTQNSKDGFTKMGDYSEAVTTIFEVPSKASLSKDIEFSHDSGAYKDPISLEMTTGRLNEIHYTTDGSEPTVDSPVYTGAVELTNLTGSVPNLFTEENVSNMFVPETGYRYNASVKNTKANIIRAAAFDSKGSRGDIFTKTYFIGQTTVNSYGLPVISIVADPRDWLDYESGILVNGRVFDEWMGTAAAQEVFDDQEWWRLEGNYTQSGRSWERPVDIEYFDNNESKFSERAGIRIKGAVSRREPQKSFNLYFREDYGHKTLDFELLPSAKDHKGNVISKYKSFSVRNGGNDSRYLKLRDSILQDLMRMADPQFETQEASPVVVFINGDFYGFEMITEKYTDSYINTRYGIDKDNVVIIKDGEVDEGKEEDIALYEELLSYADKDLTDEALWSDFKSIVDVESMADYYAAEIIIGNYDWNEIKNIALWRARKPEEAGQADTKWRWMMFDTEQSTNLYNTSDTDADYDSYQKALSEHRLLAAAMKNLEFKKLFRDSFNKFATDSFSYDLVDSVASRYDDQYRAIILMTHNQYVNNTYDDNYDSNLRSFKRFFSNRITNLLTLHPEITDDSMWEP